MAKKKKRLDSFIRKSEFPAGLKLCSENALSFLKSAKILIDSNEMNHAAILFQFAKEEAGKLAWLLELTKEESEVVKVPKELFGGGGAIAHEIKAEKAEAFFRIEAWVLKGGFDKRYYECGPKGGYELAIESDHETRLKCAFVDYDDDLKSWIKPGVEANKEVFLANIERVRTKLSELTF